MTDINRMLKIERIHGKLEGMRQLIAYLREKKLLSLDGVNASHKIIALITKEFNNVENL